MTDCQDDFICVRCKTHLHKCINRDLPDKVECCSCSNKAKCKKERVTKGHYNTAKGPVCTTCTNSFSESFDDL